MLVFRSPGSNINYSNEAARALRRERITKSRSGSAAPEEVKNATHRRRDTGASDTLSMVSDISYESEIKSISAVFSQQHSSENVVEVAKVEAAVSRAARQFRIRQEHYLKQDEEVPDHLLRSVIRDAARHYGIAEDKISTRQVEKKTKKSSSAAADSKPSSPALSSFLPAFDLSSFARDDSPAQKTFATATTTTKPRDEGKEEQDRAVSPFSFSEIEDNLGEDIDNCTNDLHSRIIDDFCVCLHPFIYDDPHEKKDEKSLKTVNTTTTEKSK